MWNVSQALPNELPHSQRNKIVYLGNLDSAKGVGSLLDLAAELQNNKACPLEIENFGEPRNDSYYLGFLRDRIQIEGLQNVRLAGPCKLS